MGNLFISLAGAAKAAEEALRDKPSWWRSVIKPTVRRNRDDRTMETGYTVKLLGRLGECVFL